MHILVSMVGQERPLLQLACFEGFWDLPPSFMKQVCDVYEYAYTATTAAELLAVLCKKLVPACTTGDIEVAYQNRLVHLDKPEGLSDILSLDWVTELFDRAMSEE
eukprot:683637-Pyramimonas_sp.AAC.1